MTFSSISFKIYSINSLPKLKWQFTKNTDYMSTIRQNRYLIDCHYIYKHGYIEMYEQVYYRDICVIDLQIFEGKTLSLSCVMNFCLKKTMTHQAFSKATMKNRNVTWLHTQHDIEVQFYYWKSSMACVFVIYTSYIQHIDFNCSNKHAHYA